MVNKFITGDQFAEYFCRMVPSARIVSGGKEILCRCMYCMDSNDPNHAHMYIHIPSDKDDPAFYNCFKCHSSGIVTSKKLMEWGIYDPLVGTNIDNINKFASAHGKLNPGETTIFNFNPAVFNYNLAQSKLDYINNRLGLNLSIETALKEKIVLNLRDSINANRLQYTRDSSIIDQLNDNFVGFLSVDNNFVNLRRICNEGIVYKSIDKRYINYNLHNVRDNTLKYYVLPTNLNLSNNRRIDFHVAEGPFDILSIKYNLRHDEEAIYAAVGGSSYLNMIVTIMNYFKIYYINLHIYPDNDNPGGYNVMDDIIKYLSPYNIPIYIHRNLYPGEKDFGVPLSRIDEKIYNSRDYQYY